MSYNYTRHSKSLESRARSLAAELEGAREELQRRQVPQHPPSMRGTQRHNPSSSLLVSLLRGWTGRPMASALRSSAWPEQWGELIVKDRKETTRNHLDVCGSFGGGGRRDNGNQEQKGWSRGNHHFRQHVGWGNDDGHARQSMQPIIIIRPATAAAAAAVGVKLSCGCCTPNRRPRRQNRGRTVRWCWSACAAHTTRVLSPAGVLVAFLASWSWAGGRPTVWSMDAASLTSGRWNYSNDWNCNNTGIGGGKGITFRSNEYYLIRFCDKKEDSHRILCEVLWIAKLHLKSYQWNNSIDVTITWTWTRLPLILPWLAKEVAFQPVRERGVVVVNSTSLLCRQRDDIQLRPPPSLRGSSSTQTQEC